MAEYCHVEIRTGLKDTPKMRKVEKAIASERLQHMKTKNNEEEEALKVLFFLI